MNGIFIKIKSFILALIFLVLSAGGLAWVSYSVIGFGEKLQTHMLTIANEKAFEDQYNALLSVVEETESDRKALEEFILNDDGDTIALLSKLDEIAINQGVEVATNQLKVEETKDSDFNILSLGYTISGPESAVVKMIQIFETLPYHGYVASLAYQRTIDEKTGRVTTVDASILLELSIRKYD